MMIFSFFLSLSFFKKKFETNIKKITFLVFIDLDHLYLSLTHNRKIAPILFCICSLLLYADTTLNIVCVCVWQAISFHVSLAQKPRVYSSFYPPGYESIAVLELERERGMRWMYERECKRETHINSLMLNVKECFCDQTSNTAARGFHKVKSNSA